VEIARPIDDGDDSAQVRYRAHLFGLPLADGGSIEVLCLIERIQGDNVENYADSGQTPTLLTITAKDGCATVGLDMDQRAALISALMIAGDHDPMDAARVLALQVNGFRSGSATKARHP
jgi:hypothetical protein